MKYMQQELYTHTSKKRMCNRSTADKTGSARDVSHCSEEIIKNRNKAMKEQNADKDLKQNTEIESYTI